MKDKLRSLPWTVLAIACVLGLQAAAQTDSGSRGACSVKGAQLWAHTEKVLVLSYPSARSASDAIEAIRAAYVSKFQQEAVMRVDDAPVCVGF
ncbi:MAG TPA: DUF3574 domain-containing protein [Steroidobacteraceae bacterium]|nr:DUF3574 domain-containing protein [Steroidobacteraceae bacterium]